MSILMFIFHVCHYSSCHFHYYCYYYCRFIIFLTLSLCNSAVYDGEGDEHGNTITPVTSTLPLCYPSDPSPVPFIEDWKDNSLNIYAFSSSSVSNGIVVGMEDGENEKAFSSKKDKQLNCKSALYGKIGKISNDSSMSNPGRVSLSSSDEDRNSGASHLPFAKVPLAQRRELTSRIATTIQTPPVKYCIFCDRNDRRWVLYT